MDSRKELLQLVTSFKNQVTAVTERGNDGSNNLSMKGRMTQNGLPPVRPLDLPAQPAETTTSLEDVRLELGDCRRCHLGETRKHLVFGEGDPHADLVFKYCVVW